MSNEQDVVEEWHDLPYFDVIRGKKGTTSVVCGYRVTEEGNKNRLIALYGENIRYCVNERTWYVYEENGDDGGVWAIDDKNKIFALAQTAVRLIHAEVSFVEADSKTERRDKQKELNKWAFKSESLHNIKAMVALSESDPRVTVTSVEFNTNPWLINCQNGTLDLRARELRKADRSDLITKITAVPYEPETVSKEWYERLLEVLPADQSAFLCRACGSGLTAINRDKALFVLYGESNSRKSTLLDAIFKTLGTYANPVNITTFAKAMLKPGSARADLVSLDGVRAAQCSEVPRGMQFNDAFLKAVTSANPQSARGLYEKLFRTILPVTKFYIETNFLPHINFDDDAAFNRFFIVPFLKTIELKECDPKIKEFLLKDENAQMAIFAWLVQGCYDWQDYGLMPPDSVNAARRDYQQSMNPLTAFIASECIEEKDAKERTVDLHERFKMVASVEERRNVPNITSFGDYLTKLGFKKEHTRNGNVRLGIRLRGLDEDLPNFDDDEPKGEQCEQCEPSLAKIPMRISEYHDNLMKLTSQYSQYSHCIYGADQATLAQEIREILLELRSAISSGKKQRVERSEVVSAIVMLLCNKHPERDEGYYIDFVERLSKEDREMQSLLMDVVVS